MPETTPATEKVWHALEAETALETLRTSLTGLSGEEARARLAQYGPNRLPPPSRRSALQRFLLQFHNVVIYVLLAAAVVTALLNHWVDTGVIAAVVLLNALIGFIQEGKAEKALDAVRRMLSPSAVAIRGGERITIPAEQLVPGDVVLLQSGDKVPADLRLCKVKNLRVEEAMLTGESVPVEKSLSPACETASLGDRRCLAYSGTLVTYGQGTGVVVSTGAKTEIGRISAMLSEVEALETPLMRKIANLGRVISVVVVVASLLMFVFGSFVRGLDMGEMFMAAVGMAVAAIPEGLPAIITITLALGVQRMAGRHAIIRRLPAVDTLGSVTVICCDKTGTLTRNEMTAQRLVTRHGHFELTGGGYSPDGGFLRYGLPVAPEDEPELMEMARAGLLCNDSTVVERDGIWVLEGDPTEGALVTAALKAGLAPQEEHGAWPRTDAIPFESEHRYMASLHHSHSGEALIYMKGAPERVLEMCSQQGGAAAAEPLDLDYWKREIESLARMGERVLAVAVRPVPVEHVELAFNDVAGGLRMLGLFGIIDPPRDEAIAAVRQCQEAGIRVKMITGDYALTASVIGARLGIGDGTTVLTGQDLDTMDDEELKRRVNDCDVYARVSPEHKLRLVTAVQANGHVAAMTGDGVNDAPALKRADVGVAMGLNGTEVAKEAADMVLTDDNFASIAHAVEEGRTVYDNLRKAVLFMLPTNGAEAAVIMLAIMLGRSLPVTPVQILWINLVTAVTLAIAFAFEPSEPGVMKRPPRPPNAPLLSGFFCWRIAFVSFLLFAPTFWIFTWMRGMGEDLEMARTAAVNMLVMLEAVYLFNARRIVQHSFSMETFFGNRVAVAAVITVIVLQLFYTYLPVSERMFGTAAIGPGVWAMIAVLCVAVFLSIELEKLMVRTFFPGVRRAA
jgi:magnesium-transporting ATPase (P-type)